MRKKAIWIVILMVPVVLLFAQKKEEKKKLPDNRVNVYLGPDTMRGGSILKKDFDSLMTMGLIFPDTNGKLYGFLFSYKERNIYEDSIGNMITVMDLLSEYYFGSKLPPNVHQSIMKRTKRGDTVYIDNIKILMKDSSFRIGKNMEFYLK